MAATANPFTKLLDFSAPVDVELVESTVNVFYGSGSQDQVGRGWLGAWLGTADQLYRGLGQQRTPYRLCWAPSLLTVAVIFEWCLLLATVCGLLLSSHIVALSCAVLLCCSVACMGCAPWLVACVQRVAAEQALKTFQEHPDAWTRVDAILEKAKTQQTKYFALQVSTPSSASAHCSPDRLQARYAAMLCAAVRFVGCACTHAYSSGALGHWDPIRTAVLYAESILHQGLTRHLFCYGA